MNELSQEEKYKKAIEFIKKVNNGYCLNQPDHKALEMLVDHENEAEKLLKELGES